jgi:hypothetical protein
MIANGEIGGGGCERVEPLSVLRYYSSICIERLRKMTKTLLGWPSLGLGSKFELVDYETRLVTLNQVSVCGGFNVRPSPSRYTIKQAAEAELQRVPQNT